MNPHDTFKRDLKDGKRVERKHLSLIQKVFPDTYIIDGYCKEWDLFMPTFGMGVEVKYDKMSQKTGNIIVETEFNNKVSGLSTTKSPWWVFDTGQEHMVVHIDKLKELLKNYSVCSLIGRGDSKPKKAYLIPIDKVRDIKNNWYD